MPYNPSEKKNQECSPITVAKKMGGPKKGELGGGEKKGLRER